MKTWVLVRSSDVVTKTDVNGDEVVETDYVYHDASGEEVIRSCKGDGRGVQLVPVAISLAYDRMRVSGTVPQRNGARFEYLFTDLQMVDQETHAPAWELCQHFWFEDGNETVFRRKAWEFGHGSPPAIQQALFEDSQWLYNGKPKSEKPLVYGNAFAVEKKRRRGRNVAKALRRKGWSGSRLKRSR